MTAGEEVLRGASADGDLEYKQTLAEAKAWARGIDEGDAQGHAIGSTRPAGTARS